MAEVIDVEGRWRGQQYSKYMHARGQRRKRRNASNGTKWEDGGNLLLRCIAEFDPQLLIFVDFPLKTEHQSLEAVQIQGFQLRMDEN